MTLVPQKVELDLPGRIRAEVALLAKQALRAEQMNLNLARGFFNRYGTKAVSLALGEDWTSLKTLISVSQTQIATLTGAPLEDLLTSAPEDSLEDRKAKRLEARRAAIAKAKENFAKARTLQGPPKET